MSGIDPSLTIEHLARRLQRAGAAHPVAGAVAQAARGASRLAVAAFAVLLDLGQHLVERGGRGEVPFGELPPPVGLAASFAGADLLTPADL